MKYLYLSILFLTQCNYKINNSNINNKINQTSIDHSYSLKKSLYKKKNHINKKNYSLFKSSFFSYLFMTTKGDSYFNKFSEHNTLK